MNRGSLNTLMTQRMRLLLIYGLTLIIIVVILSLPPIPQDQSYHSFADHRTLFGIPNLLNVISNILFFMVGILGLFFLLKRRVSYPNNAFIEKSERVPYMILFLGVIFTFFGSVYYHMAPNNARLAWDRMPMTLIFISFFIAIIAERISIKAALRLLLPLIVIGIGSVIYWYFSELKGQGDLRLYIIVQFYPILAIPLILILFPSRYTRGKDLLFILVFYAVAKVFELLDTKIFALGQIVSGHTLKHLMAAIAVYWILWMLRKRHPQVTTLFRQHNTNY